MSNTDFSRKDALVLQDDLSESNGTYMSNEVSGRAMAKEQSSKQATVQPEAFSVYNTPEQQVALLQSIGNALIACDRQWRFVYVNEQAERLMRQAKSELLGKTLWEAFPESIETPLYQACQAVMQEGKAQQCEYYASTLKTWFQSHLYPQANGLCAYFFDITQRKEAEQALQRSEGRFRISIENLLDSFGIYTALRDAEGQIVDFRVEYVNEAACISNGKTKEEQIGRGIFAEVPALHQAGLFEAYCRVIETGEPYSSDIFVYQGQYCGQQQRRVFEIRAARLGDGLTVAWRDITEHQQVIEALQRSQAKMKRLIESNIIGVIFVNGSSILEANEAFLKMVGYTREDLNTGSLNWRTMTPPEYAKSDQKALQEVQTLGACTPIEKEFFRKDGSRVPVVIGGAQLEGGPEQSICFILEITAQKELERRKDEFISMAGHELRTPLTSLKGLVQLFRRKIEKQRESDPRTYLTKMNSQVDSLTRLVNDLLDVSKIQAGKLVFLREQFDFDELVQEVVENFQQSGEIEHTISIEGASNKKIVGDRERLRQVMVNLLSNAIKYSGGAEKIEVALAATAETVTVSVRDYGIGISQEQQARIFERYYRVQGAASERASGLGIGLYISQEIVRGHNGAIRVESAAGRGSTFSVTLPIEGGAGYE